MTKGDRVWPRDEVRQGGFFEVGTVEHVSPAGYVRVCWDDGSREYYAPNSPRLLLVSGDDALPRHDWDVVPRAKTVGDPMTKNELIEILQGLPGNPPVWVELDAGEVSPPNPRVITSDCERWSDSRFGDAAVRDGEDVILL